MINSSLTARVGTGAERVTAGRMMTKDRSQTFWMSYKLSVRCFFMLDTLDSNRQQILCLVFRHNVNVNFRIKARPRRQLSWLRSHLQLGIKRGFLLIALLASRIASSFVFHCLISWPSLSLNDIFTPHYSPYMCTLTQVCPRVLMVRWSVV